MESRIHWFPGLVRTSVFGQAHTSPLNEKDVRPLRCLDKEFQQRLSQFLLPSKFDLATARTELHIPTQAGFGARPTHLPLPNSDAFANGALTLGDTMDLKDDDVHIATAGDLIWILPQIDELPANSVFFARLYGWVGGRQQIYNPCFRFMRVPSNRAHNGNGPSWRVRRADAHLHKTIRAPVPIIALSFQRAREI